MKFSKWLFWAALFATQTARAVIVEFYGTGTHQIHNGTAFVTLPFSVSFSYSSDAITTSSLPLPTTQRAYPALSLSLTIRMLDGSDWTHTSNDVGMTMNNAVNGTWDGLTISTKWPMTETVPDYVYSGTPYPVVNYSFELTKYAGGVFTNGDFSLPASPTFIGDLSAWDVKHAKMYVKVGSSDVALFNRPLSTLGEPSPIPEPSTWAALAGAMALGVVVWRRRAAGR